MAQSFSAYPFVLMLFLLPPSTVLSLSPFFSALNASKREKSSCLFFGAYEGTHQDKQVFRWLSCAKTGAQLTEQSKCQITP